MNYLKYMITSIILFSFLLVLSSNIAYSSSTVSRTTESTASICRASTDRRNVDRFDLKVGNQSFSLRYHVNGANINNISADKDNTSILIALSSSTDGTLNIELPRSAIDSKAQGNVDEDYIVFAEGQQISAEQTLTNNQLRTLLIDFENGVEEIEVQGTQDLPTLSSVSTSPKSSGQGKEQDQRSSSTFELKIDDSIHPIKYNLTGGKIINLTAMRENSTLILDITTNDDGNITIELPRNIIDSKNPENQDEDYVVFADGQHIDAEQIITNNRLRTLAIDFEKGVNRIEIAGTRIVPEFGQLNVLLLSLSIIGTLAVAMKYRRLGKT
jgi:predicted  nucleic acid-binding Zn-ribbon protein